MKIKAFILVLATLLCSCGKEEMTDKSCGWLCIEDIRISGHSVRNTKGTIDSGLSVSIYDDKGQLVHQYPAGTVPSKIALASGNYTLSVCSPNIDDWKESNGGAGAAAYRCNEAFTIEPEIYSYVKLVASMVNYCIRFSVDEGLEQWFRQFSLSVNGSNLRSLSLMQDTPGWFDDETIDVSLNVTNTDGDRFKGTPYKLTPEKGHRYTFRYTLSPSVTKEGNASLSITVDDEFEDGGKETIEI